MWIADTALVIDRHVIAAISIIGTVILLIGLLLQSIQYWVVLLNVVVQ
jgi:hypothetical protein